jgi:hypothetical protein
MVISALPATVGVLTGPVAAHQELLARAMTRTLTADPPPPSDETRPSDEAGPDAESGGWAWAKLSTSDIPGTPDLTGERLRAAVERSPRAAIACGQLLRQTFPVRTGAGLAAEAAAYSTLLGGPEFARWLAYAGKVVADPGAFFALPEVGMGLVPGAGGSVSAPRRIGRWRAAWLMLTGDRLPAATALRWGLVDEIRALPGVTGRS